LEEDEESDEEGREVWKGMNSGIEESKEETEQEETIADEKAAEVKDGEKPKAIHPFFQKKNGAKPKPADTFGGAILSSPQKSTRVSTSTTTPPPSAPERAPALKQVQRTGVKSHYFSQPQAATKKDVEYATDEETEIKDDDMYYEPPESVNREEVSSKRQFFKSYSKSNAGKPEIPYRNRSLVHSRLAGEVRPFRPTETDDVSPAKRLDFRLSSADRALGRKPLSPPRFSSFQAKESEPNSLSIPGIQNLGNTCYLSVSLQTLFGIPRFLCDLYKMYNVECIKKDMPLTKSLLEVAVAIGVVPEEQMPKIDGSVAKSKLLSTKAANPSALKKQMDVLTDKFVGYEQRDAHEFLSDLVDYLHEELVAEEKKEEDRDGSKDVPATEEDASASDKENDDTASSEVNSTPEKKTDVHKVAKDLVEPSLPPTDDYFHLKVRVCLECDTCKYSR
jgi:hypothetical protein